MLACLGRKSVLLLLLLLPLGMFVFVSAMATHHTRLTILQLAGQRKKDDGDGGLASTLAGLRTPYWG